MKKVSAMKACNTIDFTLEGIAVFRKAQRVSEASLDHVDHEGFFGELEVSVQLLLYLSYVDGLGNIHVVCRFLADPTFVPPELECLGQERIETLKNIESQIFESIAHFDEFPHVWDNVTNFSGRSFSRFQRLKEDIENNFGEDKDEPPLNLTEEEKCKYRRRRMIRLGDISFRSIYELATCHDGEQKLKTLRMLAERNLNSEANNYADLITMIRVCIALSSESFQGRYDILHHDIAKMSEALYDYNQEVRPLEVYLFACMFNWPRQNPGLQFAIPAEKIPAILHEWNAAYSEKYLRHGYRPIATEKQAYFLANGPDMSAFVHQHELPEDPITGGTMWRSEACINHLQRATGTLMENGFEVKTTLKEKGKKTTVQLPTSSLSYRSWEMRNKIVYFVIGFTSSGPRAYDLSLEIPAVASKPRAPENVAPPAWYRRQRSMIIQDPRRVSAAPRSMSLLTMEPGFSEPYIVANNPQHQE